MIEKIKIINIALTNRCNLCCKHCEIWQEEPKNDIGLDIVNRLLYSKGLDKNIDVTLTGGEPFLHKNFMNLVKLIFKKRPDSLKTISTNGTLKDKIFDFLSRFKKYLSIDFSLHVSFDGINKHEAQRAQSSRIIIDNIKAIKGRFPNINIKLKFTITPINYCDIVPTYKYATLNNLGFKIKVAENARNYTNKFNKSAIYFNREMKRSIIESLLFIYKRERVINKKEASFIRYTVQSLIGRNEKIACKAPFKRIFVMPDGKVFSCIRFSSIGNLTKNDLVTIWSSKKAEQIRNKVRIEGCNRCVSYHGFSL